MIDPLRNVDDAVKPAAYVHVGAVLAIVGVVWYMFGVLYALGGLALVSMFWIYWINEQVRNLQAAEITRRLEEQRQKAFQQPPPEMLSDEPPRMERDDY